MPTSPNMRWPGPLLLGRIFHPELRQGRHASAGGTTTGAGFWLDLGILGWIFMGKMMENDGTWDVLEFLWFFLVLVLAILRGNLEFNLWQFQEGITRITSSYGQNWKNGGMMERGFPNLETIPSWANLFSPDLWDLVETWCFPWEKTCRYLHNL